MSHYFPPHLTSELKFTGLFTRASATSKQARWLQEYLAVNGANIAIDGDWGPVTAKTLNAFCIKRKIDSLNEVSAEVHAALVEPIRAAFAPIGVSNGKFGAALIAYAKQHIAQKPIEIGGQNEGPWVRAYMDGHDGAPWSWCAGFVTTLIKQAAASLDMSPPIVGSFGCDELAVQGRKINRLYGSQPRTGDIFLVRRTATDWVHTGIVTRVIGEGAVETIEGNTNPGGSANGYGAMRRQRGTRSLDFIRLG